MQPALVDVERDDTRFDEARHVDNSNPWLVWGRYLAWRRGETRSWRRGVRLHVQRGLAVVLSSHVDGDVVRYTQMFPALRALGIPTTRVAEVLDEMDILADDRPRAFDGCLDRKLAGLAPGIHTEAETWLRVLHDGGPHSRARSVETAQYYATNALPALTEWSSRHHHLREVTRDDITAQLGELHGRQRQHTLIALRSLFSFCTKRRIVFRNPTARMKVGERAAKLLQPLDRADVDAAIAAATTPAARLILTLAAIHAAGLGQIRAMLRYDVDLGNRRLIIAGRARPLDELTHQMLLHWLRHRRQRWPATVNPHLLINQQTAVGTGPVSTVWAKKALRGHAATLERLRMDRQLDEALTHGADPLRLAVVFGLDPKTAIRYAESARQHLESAAESAQTQGSKPPQESEHP